MYKSLPALLREKPELRWEIYGLLQEEFVIKTDFHEYMKIVVGHFQTRAGRKLEDAIAGTLRIAFGGKPV